MFTDNDELAAKLHDRFARTKQALLPRRGRLQFRLDAMQAAILDIKLKHLGRYTSPHAAKPPISTIRAFAENKSITIPFREGNNKNVFHQYTLILNGLTGTD